MNLRGKHSRIQQSPMMVSATPRRFIPTSVEFVKGRDAQELQSRPSQPIPIKKCHASPQELEEDAMSADSSTHYDWATWRMHTRITTARRLRAFSRIDHSDHQQQPMIITQDLDDIAQEQVHHQGEHDLSHIPRSRQRQPSPEEELADDGVFIFDAM
eukprot:CAMPEP_0201988080 /NCGR_PEP_ID=MMETSP0904-20121228/92132_1 /ASSEMBLY_ACC=CAM_ASM_000553 /TAXON_ID=420261 /ORGANISM="Thalassiosira antarctica, Strain CCMP982" /LENGTH=156 /DNA_ID=CAMNT_0048542217 /DNA_START=509 /DNA_END=979 /DNA_ORIENTATION=+